MSTTPDEFNEFQAEENLPTVITKWEVCALCYGEGTLGGYPGVYTQEDFDEDPDFLDDYRRHRRTCENCNGRTTVKIVDEAASDPEAVKAWYAWCQDDYDTDRIYEMERRMGA